MSRLCVCGGLLLFWSWMIGIALAITTCQENEIINKKCETACCGYGTWKLADCLDGGWLPSRSTHYGSTPTGACGFGNAPNWMPNASEAGAFPTLAQNPWSGYYAAPDGAYYSQDEGTYMSCGECWEVKCADLDGHCGTHEPIVLQIADSCPCSENTKWCCGAPSDCEELAQWGTTDGCPVHCPKKPVNGPWDERSIHLDLDDAAFTAIGGPQGFAWGSLNTYIRRVPCKPKGNIFLNLQSSMRLASDCIIDWQQPLTDCFYYFEAAALNGAGLGAIARMDFWTGVRSADNTTLEYKWFMNLERDWNTPKPQERYAMFKSQDGISFFPPYRFAFYDRYGQRVETRNFTGAELGKAAAANDKYVDTGVNFELLDGYTPESACLGHPGKQKLSDTCSWGVDPPIVTPPPAEVFPPPPANPVAPPGAPPPSPPAAPPVAPTPPPAAPVAPVVAPPPPPPAPASFPWAALLPIGAVPAAYVIAKKRKKKQAPPPPKVEAPPPPPPPEPIVEKVVVQKLKPQLNTKVKKWADVDTSKYIWSREGGTARPMPVKWGEKGATEFATHLDAIGHKEVFLEKKITDKQTGRVVSDEEAKEIAARPDVEYEVHEEVYYPQQAAQPQLELQTFAPPAPQPEIVTTTTTFEQIGSTPLISGAQSDAPDPYVTAALPGAANARPPPGPPSQANYQAASAYGRAPPQGAQQRPKSRGLLASCFPCCF